MFPDDFLSAPGSSFALTSKICSWTLRPLQSMHSCFSGLNKVEMSLSLATKRGQSYIIIIYIIIIYICVPQRHSLWWQSESDQSGFFKTCGSLCAPRNQNFWKMSSGMDTIYHSDICYSLIWNLFAPVHFLDPLSPPKLLPCLLQINNTVISTPSFQYFEK